MGYLGWPGHTQPPSRIVKIPILLLLKKALKAHGKRILKAPIALKFCTVYLRRILIIRWAY
jgi:hypothetical protein